MPEKVQPIQGRRPTTRNKRRRAETTRVVFVPRDTGIIDCISLEDHYALHLLKPVEVTIDSSGVGYELLGE